MKILFVYSPLIIGYFQISAFIILVNSLFCCSSANQKSAESPINFEKEATTASFNLPNKGENKANIPYTGLNSVNSKFIHEDSAIHLNLSKSYPSKKLAIQDIADVEYIALAKSGNNIFEGKITAITEDEILGFNYKGGDIFVFDKKGQILNIINHLGNGPNEYSRINGLTYDNMKDEIFVNDMMQRKINIYDGNGTYKRSFPFIKGRVYHDIKYFNNNLICCDTRIGHPVTFFLISKLNGAKITDFKIPYKKKITSTFYFQQGKGLTRAVKFPYNEAIGTKDEIIFNEISADTIFKLTVDEKLEPLVIRTPSLSEQDPPEFLLLMAQTKLFTFFKSVKNEFDPISDNGFPTKEFLYDRENDKTYSLNLQNNDYEDENGFEIESPVGPGISVKRLDAYKLVEAYQKDKLKGKLKEIASTLNENDNPVLMIMKFKE